MVEPQSCASLANASPLCAIEHEVKGEGVNNVNAEISVELQREREKNALLMERISMLESQIQGRDKDPLVSGGQVLSQNIMGNMYKKMKVASGEKNKDEVIRLRSEMKQCPEKYMHKKNCVVNWMRIDEVEFLHSRTQKESDYAAEFEDTDNSDEDGEEEEAKKFCTDNKDSESTKEVNCDKKVNENLLKQELNGEVETESLVSSSGNHAEPTSAPVEQQVPECIIEEGFNPGISPVDNLLECQEDERKEICHQKVSKTCTPDQDIKRCKKAFLQEKPSKIAFCPKEVRRIMEPKELSEKNAHSHTIRKIIVFASLGIRHGCEDMYELDFNHFSILQKGEPYLSSNDPGEHVLYENPGVCRKIFYPNRQNPTLCPVQILEEEKAMRPPDLSCPSCLFLCIKYGGRTRNIPQTEYVRQRMGRNKLKSFGPATCQMAKLVHIRGGSFFFKALGITLLFMAGFPDDLVQREAKHRNLHLLQNYYRTDEDAQGEELFLSDPVTTDTNDSLLSPQLISKTTSTRLKCKRKVDSESKGTIAKDKSSIMLSTFSHPGTSSQLDLKGYASIQNAAITAAQSTSSQAPHDLFSATNPLINSPNPKFPQCDQSSHPVLPQCPASFFVPMMYCHPSSMFLPYPHPSLHSFSYPIAGNCVSVFPQPYHGSPLPHNLIPQPPKDKWKNHATSENADSECNCSSSSADKKITHSDKRD